MTRHPVQLAAVTGLLAVACDGFTLVGPDPAAARFHVEVRAEEDIGSLIALRAFFYPGNDANGVLGVLEDSSARVDDQTVPPIAHTNGARTYETIVASSPPLPDSVVVYGPALADGRDWIEPAVAYIPHRAGAFEQEILVGDSISVLVPAAIIPGGAVSSIPVRWSIFLLRHRGGLLPVGALQGGGRDSARVTVPWVWLSESVAPGDTLSVSFVRFQSYEFRDAPYFTTVTVVAQFQWRFLVAERPLAAARP